MDNWLPLTAQEPKSKSNFTRLTEGTHKLRVLSSAIVGYEGWGEKDGKKAPVRYEVEEVPPFGPDGKEPKYFWAFSVWNYEQERIQIMEITQKTIRTAIQAYVDNEAWGDPKTYDLVITRTGKEMQDTEYTVVANPHSDPPVVKDELPDLKVWMEGGDPFPKKEE